jgi:predicted DNA-binding transcriptional regulator AlpA
MSNSKQQAQVVLAPIDELLTEQDVSRLTGYKRNTLAVWRSTGRHRLEYIKIGRSVRYRRSTVEAWINAQQREVTGLMTRAAA